MFAHEGPRKGQLPALSACRPLGSRAQRVLWRAEPFPQYVGSIGLGRNSIRACRNQPDDWVVEIPSISGCHALMPTVEEALAELGEVFRIIEAEYREIGKPMPQDTHGLPRA